MGPLVIWALAVTGTVLSLVSAFQLVKLSINASAFIAIVEKLIGAGRFERARKLCRAGPQSPLMRLTLAALELRLEATELIDGSGVGFRQAPETVPFEQRARDAIAPVADRELRRLRWLLPAAALGAVLCAASLWPPWPTAPTAIGAVGLLAAVWALHRYRRMRQGVALVLERLPQLVLPGDAMHRIDAREVEPAREPKPQTQPKPLPTPPPMQRRELPPLEVPDSRVLSLSDPPLEAALATQDWVRAVKRLEQLAADDEGVALAAHMRRADLLERKLGDLDAAADAWLAAVRIDPTERHALARWAALCAQLQRYSDRATALQGWADAASDPAEASAVLLHLADMQQHDLEDEEGARQSYQRLLEVAPDHAVARAALERLA